MKLYAQVFLLGLGLGFGLVWLYQVIAYIIYCIRYRDEIREAQRHIRNRISYLNHTQTHRK